MPEPTRAARKTSKKRKTKKAHKSGQTSKKSSIKEASQGGRNSRKSARPTGSKSGRGDASRRSAVFDAQLSLEVNDGITRDTRAVHLQASRTTGRRVEGGSALSPTEREKSARQLTRTWRPQRIASLLSVLSHPQRIAILGKLLEGEATHKMLGKHTGLKAGPLYHHLRELRSAGLIGPKVRDLYVITRTGKRALLATLAMDRLCRGG